LKDIVSFIRVVQRVVNEARPALRGNFYE